MVGITDKPGKEFSMESADICSYIIQIIEGECSKKLHFINVMEITNMNLRKMLWYLMKPNMVA